MASGSFYLLRRSDLQRFMDSLARSMALFVPVRDGKDFNLKQMKPGQTIDLEGYSNTVYPPRQVMLPEGEELLDYSTGKVSEVLPNEKRAIFGIRPCDVHAMLVLDRVMLGHEHFETHYKLRRENTLIIALACAKSSENCFCESMGTSGLTEGFDLLFTEQGGSYHVEAGSSAGEAIASANRKLFEPNVKGAKEQTPGCKKTLDTKDLPEIMEEMRGSRIWEDVAKRCVSCASCTFSCPTCYCFNLVHDTGIGDLTKGKVRRELDYCMLLRYSRVAGGNVFREPRKERVKQFFFHKLVYGKENEGKFHCVGCGRCITECMARIDITEEVKKVRDEHAKGK